MKKIEITVYLLFILLIFASFYYDWKVQEWKYSSIQDEESFDVIVVGGEPEGVSAAVSAARNGAKTLLIDHRDGLGGLFTYGMLNYLDLSADKDGNWINRGIFTEWHYKVGGGVVFEVDKAKRAFEQLVDQPDELKLSLNTRLLSAIIAPDGKTLTGIRVQKNGRNFTLYAKRFIDCTQDADLAAMAEVPFFYGQKDIGLENQAMSASLMIHLKGVDWTRLKEGLPFSKFGKARISPTYLWGFSRMPELYKPHEPGVRVRALNIARNQDGSIYINGLQIMGINGLNPSSIKEGMERGKRETEYFVQYLRKEMPGFEKAEIADFPSELYIRETRHILAEYQLSITDIWENKDHWDSIGMASYPVDVQTGSVKEEDMVIVTPIQYAIPFRSLIPQKIDGLIVASRSSGYSSMAAGSARIVPLGMTTGQAAGAAAALSIHLQVSFRELSHQPKWVKKLQHNLRNQGVLLYPFRIDFPYQDSPIYPILKNLMKTGLIRAGYHNKLHLDAPIYENEAIEFLKRDCLMNKGNYCKQLMKWQDDHFLMDRSKPMTSQRFNQILAELKLRHPFIFNKIWEHHFLTRQEGYFLIDQALK